jgi:hypothetical protein
MLCAVGSARGWPGHAQREASAPCERNWMFQASHDKQIGFEKDHCLIARQMQ